MKNWKREDLRTWRSWKHGRSTIGQGKTENSEAKYTQGGSGEVETPGETADTNEPKEAKLTTLT